ncbi:DPP IV N-terminal domain-containing protein [Armatimonas rosea]|uniref:Tol biopolymer transport system component n=1 Tax=Armatimonas rosea TaxID=685828 RepID=A0A7W9W6R7_ARMRO|nr:DPP IV N-terminal domain-containing protein [Armatimonas rosea]MBB6050461.1 Tol biopolymer transport system component [Armatimonas rosea]
MSRQDKRRLGFFGAFCTLVVMVLAVSTCKPSRYVLARELTYDLSADGKRAVFALNSPLSVLELATGKRTTVDTPGFPRSLAYPALSPEGKAVAYSAESDLWLASLDGKSVRRLTHDDAFSEFKPRFSPDGQKLVFARPKNNPLSPTGVSWIESDVWTIRRDGTELRQLTHSKYREVSGVQFTPDSRSVIFAAQVPTDDLGGSREALFEVDAEGKQPPRELFGGKADETGGSFVGDPSLSADGKQFVLISDKANPFHYDLCLLQRDGSGFRPLGLAGPAEKGSFEQPRFAPDGKTIFYLWKGALWQVSTEGKEAHAVQ